MIGATFRNRIFQPPLKAGVGANYVPAEIITNADLDTFRNSLNASGGSTMTCEERLNAMNAFNLFGDADWPSVEPEVPPAIFKIVAFSNSAVTPTVSDIFLQNAPANYFVEITIGDLDDPGQTYRVRRDTVNGLQVFGAPFTPVANRATTFTAFTPNPGAYPVINFDPYSCANFSDPIGFMQLWPQCATVWPPAKPVKFPVVNGIFIEENNYCNPCC